MSKADGTPYGNEKDWMAALGEELDKDEAAQFNAFEEPIQEASFNREEIVKLAELSVNMLAGLATPEMFQFNFPPVLMAAWKLLTQSAVKARDFSQIALGIPRGHGKTTLIKLFVLFCILFTKKRFILVICSTATLAENILADIEDMLNQPNIKRLFGDWKLGMEINRQDLKKFGYRGRPIVLAAIGANGSMRGLNIKNERPDVMIFEDIQTKECSESKVQSEALERWMIGTAMKAKSPMGCMFIFCGNMYPGPNSLLKKLKANKTWVKFISGAILADGTALWEELRPMETLIAELDNDIEMGHPEIFFSEVLNDTEAGINSRIDFAQIREWPWAEYDIPQGRFLVIDPATDAVNADCTAIGYFEIYDGVPALRKVAEEVLSPGNTIRRALLMALQNKCRLIVVEGVSYQATLLYWFGVIAEELGITGLTFLPIHPSMKSKNSRIATMLRALTAGEIIIHPETRARVTKQIADWNPLKRQNVDGILDLLTYAPKVLEEYPADAISHEDLNLQEAASARVHENLYPF